MFRGRRFAVLVWRLKLADGRPRRPWSAKTNFARAEELVARLRLRAAVLNISSKAILAQCLPPFPHCTDAALHWSNRCNRCIHSLSRRVRSPKLITCQRCAAQLCYSASSKLCRSPTCKQHPPHPLCRNIQASSLPLAYSRCTAVRHSPQVCSFTCPLPCTYRQRAA